MKKTLLIFVLYSIALVHIKAHNFDHLMHFQFSYGVVKPLGKKNVNENGFVMPSFYANYSSGSQFSMRATYKIRPLWGVGAEFGHIQFNRWKYDNEDMYSNSSSSLNRYGLLLKFHSKFKYEGIFNKIQLYTIVNPFYNSIKITIEEPALPFPQDIDKIERSSGSLGINLTTGMNYTFARNLSAFVEGGYSFTPVESQLLNDKSLKTMHFNFGLCLHFKKSKFIYE